MKIGIGYNSLYGKEFIEESINYMREFCSFVVVVHEKYKDCDDTYKTLEKLKNKGLIDELVYVECDIIEKRNIALELCRSVGCEYFIPLDTDEIIDVDILKEIDVDIDTYYSPIVNYFNYTRTFLDWYYVQSIIKIDDRMFKQTNTSYVCDSFRVVDERSYKITKSAMHHNSINEIAINNKINFGIIRDQQVIDKLKYIKSTLTSDDIYWFCGSQLKKYDEINTKKVW